MPFVASLTRVIDHALQSITGVIAYGSASALTASAINGFAARVSAYARARTIRFLERQADLEYLDRVEVEFRVQTALDGGRLAKAVLLA